MLLATVSPAQHCHIIGYGICAQEDKDAHVHVVKCLKAEIERLVADRADMQILI